jgi:5-methylcytosine-specific restriction endonuclease McrA
VRNNEISGAVRDAEFKHNRIIPTAVKFAVFKRDGGKGTKCGASDGLHFDHILAYSRGGSSVTEENIQLLCARHNLQKGARQGRIGISSWVSVYPAS